MSETCRCGGHLRSPDVIGKELVDAPSTARLVVHVADAEELWRRLDWLGLYVLTLGFELQYQECVWCANRHTADRRRRPEGAAHG